MQPVLKGIWVEEFWKRSIYIIDRKKSFGSNDVLFFRSILNLLDLIASEISRKRTRKGLHPRFCVLIINIMSQFNLTTSINTPPRSESDDSRPTAMATVNAAWRETYSPVPISTRSFEGTTRIQFSKRVDSVAIPFRPLDNEIWFNHYVMEPFSCLAPPPPMGVLMKKYGFLVKPKQIFCYGKKDKSFYHTVMSKDSTRRRRTLGSQASREKWKNKLHARRMKATVLGAAAAAAPSSVIDPAPPAVDQKELLGSGYEQCASTGRIVRFSRRQRAKALA